MDQIKQFEEERKERVNSYDRDDEFKKLSLEWVKLSFKRKYEYNFQWLGRPIIQYPQDMWAMQEIIWEVKPDLIIDIGIAHGGSLIYYASLLEILGNGEVLGVDIDIRSHNRAEIEKHTMYKRIKMIEGSSISEEIVAKVKEFAKGKKRILVCLDSNHTHEHVYNELLLYSPLVTKGSYVVVYDTFVEDMPDDFFTDRPWHKGDNPKTAVHAFIKGNKDFVIDKSIENKILITSNPDGYLKRIK